jgi:drug/metabolite transporter (DMT)-like permease
MRTDSNTTAIGRETRATVAGLAAVVAFSLTLPATRVAVAELGGPLVGLGRALVAALIGGALLLARRERWPLGHGRALGVVAATVVVGFPLCSAMALGTVPASHAAIVVGLLPLATAGAAVLRDRERPPFAFWAASIVAAGAIGAFALAEGGGRLQAADLWLLAAVLAGGLGYAEGGRLARELGGWRVISWALVLATPVVAAPLFIAWRGHAGGVAVAAADVHARAWLGFGYLSLISMFLAFVLWYGSLAAGGVARNGQLQLVQPFLTLIWAHVLLDEPLRLRTLATLSIVLACIVISRHRPAHGRSAARIVHFARRLGGPRS